MGNPSLKHQKLVGSLINHFVSTVGYRILSAAHGDYSEPQKHGRHKPDIVAKDQNDIIHLAEAKVGEDLLSENTKEQFIDFSSRIMINTNESVIFHIIVYKEDEFSLRSILNQIGLGQKIGNTIQIWTLNS